MIRTVCQKNNILVRIMDCTWHNDRNRARNRTVAMVQEGSLCPKHSCAAEDGRLTFPNHSRLACKEDPIPEGFRIFTLWKGGNP